MTPTLDQRIIVDPKVRGGKPCISGHRISVSDVVIWHEYMAKDIDEIALEYDLSVVDIYVALAYYYANQKEIDLSIQQSEKYASELKVKIPSKVKQRLGE
ncbi:MAG: DUF433 domain-containing protein [Lewinella sp.]|nr:DUF433 domain-containing protein [Lewinella sp.]